MCEPPIEMEQLVINDGRVSPFKMKQQEKCDSRESKFDSIAEQSYENSSLGECDPINHVFD